MNLTAPGESGDHEQTNSSTDNDNVHGATVTDNKLTQQFTHVLCFTLSTTHQLQLIVLVYQHILLVFVIYK